MSQDAAWLPSEIADQLTELKSWVRWQWLLRGAGRVGMIASLGLAGAFLADYRYDLAPTTRIAVLSSVVAVTLLAFLAWVVVPLCRRIGWAELAAMADKANPRWEGALTSAVELFDPTQPDGFKGSPVMREMLLKQTRQRIDELDLEKVVSSRKAWSSVRWGLASCVLLAIPVFVAPSMYRQLWQRFLMPWGNWGTAGAWTVAVENGDRIVARGTDVELLATAEKPGVAEPPKSLTLEWRDSAGTTDRRAMPFDEARKSFVALVPHVMRDFDFRIAVERQKSRDYKVQVVEPPVVTKIRLDVEPPAYAGWPAQSLDGAIGAIKVFEKSRLKFTLEFNKPVETAQLVWRQHGDANKKLELAGSKQTATLEVTADPAVAGPFLFTLEDIHKLPNNDTVPRELVVVTDEAPRLAVKGDHSTEARPDDVVPIDVTASDDVGLGSLELHLIVEEKPREPITVEAVRGQKDFEHRFTLDLSQLNVEHGQWLNYRVRITDERPDPGPHEVWSEPRVLRISKKAAPPGANELAKSHEQLRDELNDLRRDIDAKKNDLADLRKESVQAKKKDAPPDGEHVAQLQRELRTLTERAEKLAEQLNNDPLFHELGEKAEQVAQNELTQAEAEIQQARNDVDQNLTQEQRNHVREAEQQLEAASKKLAQLEKPFEQLADLQKDLLELRRLARQAEQLANRADELAKANANKHDAPASGENQPEALARDEKQAAADAAKTEQEKQQLAEQQKQLADALNDLLKRRPELLAAARREQLEQLGELAEEARQLAEQQKELADALRQQQAAAAERNAELAEKQQDLQKRAEAATKKAVAAKPAGDEPKADKPATSEALQEAVASLKQGDLAEAQKQQQQAANELDRLAAELQQAKANQSPLAQAARELANEQKKLADKAAEAQKSDDAEQRQQAAEQLQREQAALSEQIENLPQENAAAQASANDNKNNDAKPSPAQAAREQAEQRSEQAQQALEAGDLNKAAQEQRRAEQALRELAKQAENANKPLPQQARELANEQAQLAAKAAEAQKSNNADERQQAAEQLQREQAALNERIENLPQNNPAANPAAETNPAEPNAAQAARQAAEQRAEQAEQALADGNLERAAQEQRRAEQALRELAQQAAQQPMPEVARPPSAEPPNRSAEGVQATEQLAQLAEEQRQLAQEVAQALNEQRGENPRGEQPQSNAAQPPAANEQANAKNANKQPMPANGQQPAGEDSKPNQERVGEAGKNTKEESVRNDEDSTEVLTVRLFDEKGRSLDIGKYADELRLGKLLIRDDVLGKYDYENPSFQTPNNGIRQVIWNSSGSSKLFGVLPIEEDLAAEVVEGRAASGVYLEHRLPGHEGLRLHYLLYSVKRTFAEPRKPPLATLSSNLNRRGREFYVSLPVEWPLLKKLAQELKEEQLAKEPAGATQAEKEVAIALRMRDELRGFKYMPLSAVKDDDDKALNVDDFVRRKKAGHCACFADALTWMLRAVDIPARSVGGFKGGKYEPSDINNPTGYLVVRKQDAHAWVEAYLDGHWLILDATPGSGGDTPGQKTVGGNGESQVAQQAQDVRAAQRELAEQAQELQKQVQQELGRESDEAKQAQVTAEQAQASRRQANSGQFDKAAESGVQAGKSDEKLAEQLQNNPRAKPELAQQAAELAERQQAVAQQMEQLGQKPGAKDAAQQQRQQELNNAAGELGQQLSELQSKLGQQPLNLPQQAEGAKQAGQQAANSQQNMQAAQQSSLKGDANKAAQSAEQASENLQKAAEQAQAAAERNRPPQSPIPRGVGGEVAEAAQRLRQAQQEAKQPTQASAQENGQPMPSQSGQPAKTEGQKTEGQKTDGQKTEGQKTEGQKTEGQQGQGQSSQSQSQGQSGQGQAQGQGQGQSSQSGQGKSSGQGQQGQSQGQGQGQSQGQGRSQGQAPGQGRGSPSSADGQTADAPLAQAARQLRAAARALSDAANQSAAQPAQGGQPQPGEPQNDPNGGNQIAQAGGGGSGQGNMEQDRGENLNELQTQVKKMTGRNWGQLSSKLKTELSQQAKHQAHGDYSKLIKLYFQEIAKTQPDAEGKR